MIELKIANLKQVRETFSRLVPETQDQALRGLAQVAFDTAQTQVDTHTQTGALARSLRLRPQGDSGWIIDHDIQYAPYATFVHWGWLRTRPIYPKERKALRWVSGGKFIFATWVKTLAQYEGDPWLVKAADEAVRQFDAIVQRIQRTTHPNEITHGPDTDLS